MERGKCVKKKEIEGGFCKNTNINKGVWTSSEPLKKFRD
jgi:hypothetical protein